MLNLIAIKWVKTATLLFIFISPEKSLLFFTQIVKDNDVMTFHILYCLLMLSLLGHQRVLTMSANISSSTTQCSMNMKHRLKGNIFVAIISG